MFQRIKSRMNIEEAPAEPELQPQKVRRLSLLWKNIAAILIVGICAFFYYQYLRYRHQKNISGNVSFAKTPSRTKSRIYLSDGTVVTLNSETTLKYPSAFDGATREVYLDGEAFFDVAKDAAHPFIVHAGKMNIRVLGTAFNVKSYLNDKDMETTLIRGAIEVTLSDRPSDRIILKPNEKLILSNTAFKKPQIDPSTPVAEESTGTDTDYSLTNLTHFKSNDTTIVETSWVNNELVFKDEDFGELANRMERWYGVKIKFKSADARNYRFTGMFVKENVLEAMNALKLIERFNYKYKNETIYIY
jgi:transmembrane sensor